MLHAAMYVPSTSTSTSEHYGHGGVGARLVLPELAGISPCGVPSHKPEESQIRRTTLWRDGMVVFVEMCIYPVLNDYLHRLCYVAANIRISRKKTIGLNFENESIRSEVMSSLVRRIQVEHSSRNTCPAKVCLLQSG